MASKSAATYRNNIPPRSQLEHSTERVENIHLRSVCIGSRCPIHKRSNHSLRYAKQSIDFISVSNSSITIAVTIRKCGHGYEHVDPDESTEYLHKYGKTRTMIEGPCDGCCITETNEEF